LVSSCPQRLSGRRPHASCDSAFLLSHTVCSAMSHLSLPVWLQSKSCWLVGVCSYGTMMVLMVNVLIQFGTLMLPLGSTLGWTNQPGPRWVGPISRVHVGLDQSAGSTLGWTNQQGPRWVGPISRVHVGLDQSAGSTLGWTNQQGPRWVGPISRVHVGLDQSAGFALLKRFMQLAVTVLR